MSKTYAYVTAECCTSRLAFQSGDTYHGEPVSRHSDLWQWRYGKRETLRIMRQDPSAYRRAIAWRVVWLLGWDL